MATLFSDFLTALHVPHTTDYSDRRFFSMPFQSMFGLTKLLQEYGVATIGVKADDKSAFGTLPVPFLADTPDGFAIVTGVEGGQVRYMSQSQSLGAPVEEFVKAWNGVALLATPTATATEPEYGRHHFVEVMGRVKNVMLWVAAAVLLAVVAYSTEMWRSPWHWVVAAIDAAGVYVSFMLVQKSLNIKNRKADAVCSVLQEGGCDTIAKSEASSFMGIVKWSEVGLAYFGVSLGALLLFPGSMWPWLTLVNLCCLPYTVWSICYQKFVAKTWCTLCVTVQACLWLLFFGYLLGGGWEQLGQWWHALVNPKHTFAPNWHALWPLLVDFCALVAAYAVALLGLNRFDNALSRLLHPNNNLIDHDNDNSNADTVG